MGSVEIDPLVTRRQARETYFAGICRATLWRWESAGKLPPPIRVSPRKNGWRKSTLERFVAQGEAGGARV